VKVAVPSLTVLVACGCAAAGAVPGARVERAVLGVATEEPSRELAQELSLPFEVRQQGRVVTSAAGPARAAGVREGDVLLAAGEVELYSQDDLDDVVRASWPGDEVVLALRRRGEAAPREMTVELGSELAEALAGIVWCHASLASLPRALEEARTTGKNVLVGLSGAET
jgi:S1-C subfamily serine protease